MILPKYSIIHVRFLLQFPTIVSKQRIELIGADSQILFCAKFHNLEISLLQENKRFFETCCKSI